ncbi:hypothetical protein APX73_23870 [Escherichia coli]|nr:hypothetical protein APX73_23870 [Escherichia coli]
MIMGLSIMQCILYFRRAIRKVLSKIAHFVDGKYFTAGEIFTTTSFMQDYAQPIIRLVYLKILLPG